jgi:hypothetical protein
MDDLVQAVVQDVPEAPLMTVRDMLAWAQGRLCREGNAWVVIDEPVVVASDTPYAEMEAPSGAVAVRLLQVMLDGRALTPGIDYHQVTPTRVEFNDMPDQSLLYGRMAVAPMPGESMPDELLQEYAETLRHGALSRLLLLPQPWRDAEKSMYHEKLWRAGVNDAKRLNVYGYQPGARVRKRRFI